MSLAIAGGLDARMGTTVVAAFLASLVECVEALTVVLAVGSVRGWRSALAGAATALMVLGVIVAALGPALTRIPLRVVQLAVGTMILLFGLRWLRKAILRSAGLIPLHDEAAAFAKSTAAMRGAGRAAGLDKVAFTAAFHITMLEGTEVVFIVIALGAGGTGLLLPAALGAAGALMVVAALGLALHRPLARVPENTLKFVVGVLLSAFGTFWVGEGAGVVWRIPARASADLAIPALMGAYLALALLLVLICRARTAGVEG
jgi:Ca2+/H+ antiporter, TMEM165/GDT1 family